MDAAWRSGVSGLLNMPGDLVQELSGSQISPPHAGIAAAAISLAGIIAAKWMIYVNCMAPIISTAVMESLYGEGETVPGFFSLMFGPMDGIFVLLAFFTAYKVGSGKPSSED